MDPSKCNVEKNSVVRYLLMKAIPWIFSVLLVFIMLVLMVFFQKNDYQEEETVTVREVDIALPLPPPPPPPAPTLPSHLQKSARRPMSNSPRY